MNYLRDKVFTAYRVKVIQLTDDITNG